MTFLLLKLNEHQLDQLHELNMNECINIIDLITVIMDSFTLITSFFHLILMNIVKVNITKCVYMMTCRMCAIH